MALLGPCPAGWVYCEMTDSCFYVSSVALSQTEARAECQGMGGDLASIGDRAEYRFVFGLSFDE